MSWTNASNDPEEIKKLLEDNWEEFQETPKPKIVIVNDPDGEKMYANLNISDYITIAYEGNIRVKYRGNISYFDRTIPMTIQTWTKHGRLRNNNLMKEVRSIFFDKKHDMDNHQLIRIIGYSELVNEAQKVWKGILSIQLESAGVQVESNS